MSFGAKKRATRDGALRGNRREQPPGRDGRLRCSCTCSKLARCAELRVATATCAARLLLAGGRPTRILLLSQPCPCTLPVLVCILLLMARSRRDETFLCTVVKYADVFALVRTAAIVVSVPLVSRRPRHDCARKAMRSTSDLVTVAWLFTRMTRLSWSRWLRTYHGRSRGADQR